MRTVLIYRAGWINKRATLQRMPYDIIFLILKLVSPCTATCIGLTCKNIYGPYKALYPQPVKLIEPVCEREPYSGHGARDLRLHHLIKNWGGLGPKYRFADYYPQRFLIKDVYGEVERGFEQRLLCTRYYDYNNSFRAGKELLPNPYNMGQSWHGAAIAVIRRDISHFENWAQLKKFWSGLSVFETNFELFEKEMEDYVLGVIWVEGCEMMDF